MPLQEVQLLRADIYSYRGQPLRNLQQSQFSDVASSGRKLVMAVNLKTTEHEIREISAQFYAALNRMLNGDARALSNIWSHRSFVTAMHPLGGRQLGWTEVRKTWEQIAQRSSEGKVQLKDQLIRVAREVAYEVGVEHVESKLGGQKVAVEIRVTNIYQREGGAWKITHHHTDMSPALVWKFSTHSRREGEFI